MDEVSSFFLFFKLEFCAEEFLRFLVLFSLPEIDFEGIRDDIDFDCSGEKDDLDLDGELFVSEINFVFDGEVFFPPPKINFAGKDDKTFFELGMDIFLTGETDCNLDFDGKRVSPESDFFLISDFFVSEIDFFFDGEVFFPLPKIGFAGKEDESFFELGMGISFKGESDFFPSSDVDNLFSPFGINFEGRDDSDFWMEMDFLFEGGNDRNLALGGKEVLPEMDFDPGEGDDLFSSCGIVFNVEEDNSSIGLDTDFSFDFDGEGVLGDFVSDCELDNLYSSGGIDFVSKQDDSFFWA